MLANNDEGYRRILFAMPLGVMCWTKRCNQPSLGHRPDLQKRQPQKHLPYPACIGAIIVFMGLPHAIHQMTAHEFTAWELDQPERHEFFRGEVFRVFGMGGARREHVRVSMNIARALGNHLTGTPCQAYMADMKIHIEATGDMFYPDILVTCDPRDLSASLEMQHPKLVIEVLSPSTATFDRGDKFLAYRQIAALQEYALVDPHTKTFEVYRRQPNLSDWLLTPGRAEEGLVLHSVALTLPVAAVFENV